MKYIPILIVAALAGCASLGSQQSTLAVDCATQAGAVQQATAMVKTLNAAERATIDGQIALSKPYCSGPLPADQVAASKVVQASTAKIGAVLAVASSR